jgi:hypothetical protein
MEMEEIEKAIDEATEKVKKWPSRRLFGSRDDLIKEVIEPLQAKLRAGVAAGLYGSESRIRTKFRRLERALKQFDEGRVAV